MQKCHTPQRVQLPSSATVPVVACCGSDCSVVVTDSGQVFATGVNKWVHIGVGGFNFTYLTLTSLLTLIKGGFSQQTLNQYEIALVNIWLWQAIALWGHTLDHHLTWLRQVEVG